MLLVHGSPGLAVDALLRSEEHVSERSESAVRGRTEERESDADWELVGSGDEDEREHDLMRWFLLTGNRRFVTLALLGAVFASLVAGANLWQFEMRTLLQETNTVKMLFNTLLSGIILLVSIVVSITSVVLSQELGSLETHHERVETSLEFRQELESVAVGDVSPSKADDFLGFVLETLYERTLALESAVEGHPDEELREEVEELVEVVDTDLQAVSSRLSPLNLERSNVLLAGFDYDYAKQLHGVRHIREEHGDALDEEQQEAFQALADALNFFAASREYFKSLFFKREMADLTVTLLYVALPTIIFTSYVLLALDARLFPEVSLLGISILVLYVSFAFTVALAPYLVLTAYVLRTAFVARRSLEVGPFMVGSDVSKPDLEWED